ncbi:MerR family transcriptional regulator [uncultured Ferrimonas sp.]|uniref:MerR family transcriptional regulator n=1 Tax=uncultured Ferrimonas sp. TaxID=432640 RepID=UPI0026143EC1|nr:MerR family transcriptional regulator [uncultured Ferrimonas sp.]
MYQITQLAKLCGLSRTALLYYEKLGLIHGQRQPNGYRVYHDSDLQQVRLIQQLQAGGLTLAQCKRCLEAKLDRAMLSERLQQLEQEIAAKQQAHALLNGLLGNANLQQWHQQLDALAPDAHMQWLITQGFTEKQALRLRWLSKEMNQHDSYMADFMAIFNGLERWGPGSATDSLRALAALPAAPQQLLEIGCGNGLATALLAEHTQAQICAIDNEETALAKLSEKMAALGFGERVQPHCASMTALPFQPNRFDLIWCEGSAYIMGVEQALQQWRPLLQAQGCLVMSDLVWLTEQPSAAAKAFWHNDYPAMTNVSTRLQQIEAAGYQVLTHFSLSEAAWAGYAQPLQQRVNQLKPSMSDSQAIADIETELDIYANHLGEFGYQMFVLQKQ